MKIVNPIYDNAFKYMMDNEDIAKIVLSIILDTKVIDINAKPQEANKAVNQEIFITRFDYKAVILDENGENKTVIIEIQKYNTRNPIDRFRNYLALNYQKKETYINTDGDRITSSLPIISIYILGYDLKEFNCRAIRIDNKPFDIIQQKQIDVKSKFVELLTHKSFILIAAKKNNIVKRNTRLEKFLDLFIQKFIGEDKNTIIDVNPIDDDSELMSVLKHLNEAILDEQLIINIQAERDHLKDIEELEIDIKKAKEKLANEKIKTQIAESKAKKSEEEAKETNSKLKSSVELLLELGLSQDKITENLNISIEQLNNIINSEH
jgi:hypothetical protein